MKSQQHRFHRIARCSAHAPRRVMWLGLLASLALLGCEPGRPGAPDGGAPDPRPHPDGGSAIVAGAACVPGTPPRDCFSDPIARADGRISCSGGTRYCRDGAWTTCEDLRDYVIALPKSLGEPTACNVCDPGCTEQTTTPVETDLTPDNSAGVHYDPIAPGITIPPAIIGEPGDEDGDGIADLIDDCPGPGHRVPCDGSTAIETEGFAFSLTPGATEEARYPRLELALSSVDYYVLMDTSGSMNEEIGALQDDLVSGTFVAGCGNGGILGAIRCKLPNTAFGVGMVREYPRSLSGDPVDPPAVGDTDAPYYHLLDPTLDLALAQNVVDSLSTNSTHTDFPEATGQALFAMASGRGLGPYVPGRHTCAAGGRGFPCFRAGSIPVVLVITDAPIQNGPGGYSYGTWATTPGTYTPAALLDQPPVTTVDVEGKTLYERANASQAFELGDLTSRSVTVAGTTYDSPLSSTRCRSPSSPSAPRMRFTLSAPATIRIDTFGAEFDTMIALLRANGTYYGGSTSTACNDDRPDAAQLRDPEGRSVYDHASYLRFVNLPAGTYQIDLRGYGAGDEGAFQVRVRNESAPGSLTTSAPTAQSWAATVAALQSIGAKTIGIAPCAGATGTTGAQCNDAVSDLEGLGYATGSVNAIDGTPFVFKTSNSAAAFSSTIVAATMELADHLRLDVGVGCVDNDATPVDECALFAVSGAPVGFSCPASCTGGYDGSSCLSCAPGSELDFDLSVTNVGVTPSTEDQVFEFFVRLLGDGASELSRYPVKVIVPGVGGDPTEGYFEMVYASPERCNTPHMRPRWGVIEYDALIPPGASVRAELRVAPNRVALAVKHPVTVLLTDREPEPDAPLDVGAALRAAGESDRELYLSVRFVLRSDDAGRVVPALRSFDFAYHCEDFE